MNDLPSSSEPRPDLVRPPRSESHGDATDAVEYEITHRYDVPVFYSTNPWLKWYLNQAFREKKHYVWCADAFRGSRLGARAAPSSTPRDIYRELLRDVQGHDRHSYRINAQRATLRNLCAKWYRPESLDYQEFMYLVDKADFEDWRPVIYIIPQSKINPPGRIHRVPPEEWAGLAREYIIQDLKDSEFDLIEP